METIQTILYAKEEDLSRAKASEDVQKEDPISLKEANELLAKNEVKE